MALRNAFSALRCAVSCRQSPLSRLLQREDNEEVLPLHDRDRSVLSQNYEKWYAPIWHSWSRERKKEHIKYFQVAAQACESSLSTDNATAMWTKCYFGTVKCGNCHESIIQFNWLLVRSNGNSSWIDSNLNIFQNLTHGIVICKWMCFRPRIFKALT